MADFNFSINDSLVNFKENMIESKKYWITCLVLILIGFFALMNLKNFYEPEMEISILVISSLLSVLFISFYQGHSDDENFYKTAFLVILIFGIVFSFITPIMCTHDEFEHFVRSEITSNGIIYPEYIESPFTLDNETYKGYYLTIQSTFDLAEKGKPAEGYTLMDILNSSIYNTDADTQPINYTPAKYHSAFNQNPFYGYLASGLGMAVAKLLNLNAIWLLWLGRIFNSLLYAALAAYAIKKTPILKIPLFVVACIPAALSQAASVSIDPLINGLALISIAYFLVFYKSPKNSIDYKSILKFSVLVLLLSFCKATYFCFIFLLLFIPKDNLKEKKYFYYNALTIVAFLGIMALWSKYYVNPGLYNTSRYIYFKDNGVNAVNQIKYMITHKKFTIKTLFHLFSDNLDYDLKCRSYINTRFSSVYLMFTGAVYLLYPHEKINFKTKIGALLVFLMLYIGTYLVFMVTWNPLGELVPHGVQARYFFPAFALIPIFLGFNHMKGDKSEIDSYLVVLTIAFIIYRILTITIIVY